MSLHLVNTNQPYIISRANQKIRKQIIRKKDLRKPEQKYLTFNNDFKTDFEIFAYCSKNYYDAYCFVIQSWLLPNVSKVTIYTDFNVKSKYDKVEIIPMFKDDQTKDWIVGTGRRLDVIKHFIGERGFSNQNVLFLDIDCLITRDISHVFSRDFDIAISRLFSTDRYANSTATAGLWFARLTPGFHRFFNDWYRMAMTYRGKRKGITPHHISYVQYSFTSVARNGLKNRKYKILPIDQRLYNSEHSLNDKWLNLIQRHNPYILHFKGRRWRRKALVRKVMDLVK